MTTALVSGYYGHHNAGDDAFLAVCAWGARRFFGCDQIYATAQRIPDTYGVPVRPLYFAHNLRGNWRWNYPLTRRAAGQADTVIFGGGSNFHTAAIIEHYRDLLRAAQPGRRFAAGVSVGPFLDADAEAACARILTELDFTGVRDEASLARARRIAPGANVELTFDIAPLLLQAAHVEAAAASKPRRGLGIALCHLGEGSGAAEHCRVSAVAEAIRQCASEGLIEEVVLVDFNAHPRTGDHRLHRELAAALPVGLPVVHLPYRDDPAATMRAVANVRGMLAMRLHAAVFGFCTGTPTLIFAYHEKCWEWSRMVGASPDLVLDALDPQPEALAVGLVRLLSPDVPPPALTVATAQEKALRNWTWGKP